jgi:hypothetical protein
MQQVTTAFIAKGLVSLFVYAVFSKNITVSSIKKLNFCNATYIRAVFVQALFWYDTAINMVLIKLYL